MLIKPLIHYGTTGAGRSNLSSLQGYVRTTYNRLVEVFGVPQYDWSELDKSTVNWVLEIDGEVVTIYDWKTNTTPPGMYDWHVGGFDSKAVEMVEEALKCHA